MINCELTPDHCPNAVKTKVFIETLHELNDRVSTLVTEDEFNEAFKGIRAEQKVTRELVVANRDSIQELLTLFIHSKAILNFFRWAGGVVIMILSVWLTLHELGLLGGR